jgi:hypothetical protein
MRTVRGFYLMRRHSRTPAAPHDLRRRATAGTTEQQHRSRGTIMGKGDKQHGNREAKKPKADKKAAPAGSTFLKPQAEVRKPGGKPASK